jgi:glucosamine kinase
MTLYMGIDGGGSNLRVTIVDENLQIQAESQHASANPSIVGKSESAYRIQYTMRDAMARAKLAPQDVRAVGIGVAGASASHSADWLIGVVSAVAPKALIVPSGDMEIALVGSHGERRGVLILSGTGSVAYGINAEGKNMQVGGWGYLLGDEGSGYWLGWQSLQRMVQAADGRAEAPSYRKRILQELALAREKELITWLYAAPVPRTREIAALAPFVLQAAETGDAFALELVERAAHELEAMVRTVQKHLGLTVPPVAFAGSLLTNLNPLSDRLCKLLDLSMLPEAKYTPVIGAALLAKLTSTEAKTAT